MRIFALSKDDNNRTTLNLYTLWTQTFSQMQKSSQSSTRQWMNFHLRKKRQRRETRWERQKQISATSSHRKLSSWRHKSTGGGRPPHQTKSNNQIFIHHDTLQHHRNKSHPHWERNPLNGFTPFYQKDHWFCNSVDKSDGRNLLLWDTNQDLWKW